MPVAGLRELAITQLDLKQTQSSAFLSSIANCTSLRVLKIAAGAGSKPLLITCQHQRALHVAHNTVYGLHICMGHAGVATSQIAA